MNGYIAISSDSWCDNLKKEKLKNGVFWRKRKNFSALVNGEYYFFLKRSRKEGKRFVVGYGNFVRNTILTTEEAWAEFGISVGAKSKAEFLTNVESIYKSSSVELGCIVLENIKFFDCGVTLEQCDVDFSPSIVSGKTIDESACHRLIAQLEGEQNEH